MFVLTKRTKMCDVVKKCDSCYTSTPVTVFKSDNVCDTKRIKRCDPLYGMETAGYLWAFGLVPEYEESYQRIDYFYKLILSDGLGKINSCQMKAISVIFTALFRTLGEFPTGVTSAYIYIALAYVDVILTKFGDETISDDCKDFLSAVAQAVAGYINAVGLNSAEWPVIDTLTRTGLARAAISTPCCCRKDFIAAVLGPVVDTGILDALKVGDFVFVQKQLKGKQGPLVKMFLETPKFETVFKAKTPSKNR